MGFGGSYEGEHDLCFFVLVIYVIGTKLYQPKTFIKCRKNEIY
jgi:hypothetical protein